MFIKLLKLEWKAFFRSVSLKQDIGIKVFIAVIMLYASTSLLLLGVNLYAFLEKLFPYKIPMEVVNTFLIVWLLAELIMRTIMQSLPIINIKPLLPLPIKRSLLIHFLLVKSIFSIYNLLWVFLFIPFGMAVVRQGDYSISNIFGWWLTILGCILCLNFINFWISKKLLVSTKSAVLFGLSIGLLVLLDYFDVFKTTDLFASFMDLTLDHTYLSLLPFALVALLYYVNYHNLLKSMNLDFDGGDTKAEASGFFDWVWIRRFGNIAPFLSLDLRLIWRNKRAKNTLWSCLLFSLYGLFFFSSSESFEISIMTAFVGVFMTGIFVVNFGQFIPAWDSAYYSMLMTQNISMNQYLRSKAILMYTSIIAMSILTTPYVYYGWSVLGVNLASAVYNAGVNVPLVLYVGSYNKKRIDLNKSPTFNYQGTGMAQWILVIPILLGPIIIWGITKGIFNEVIATFILAVSGAIGLVLRNYFLTKIAERYNDKKFEMIYGFKQEN